MQEKGKALTLRLHCIHQRSIVHIVRISRFLEPTPSVYQLMGLMSLLVFGK